MPGREIVGLEEKCGGNKLCYAFVPKVGYAKGRDGYALVFVVGDKLKQSDVIDLLNSVFLSTSSNAIISRPRADLLNEIELVDLMK